MIQFINKEFITENKPGEGVLVLDTHLQGAWETSDHARLRWSFPRTYKAYQATCFKDYKRVGTSMLLEEDGYKIALLFTRQNRKESKEKMMDNLSLALQDLFRKVPCDVYLYSPILARSDGCFNEIVLMLNKLTKPMNYIWHVCRKECPVVVKEQVNVTD